MKKLINLWPSEEQKSALYVSRKLPTYPSPKPTLTLTSHLGQIHQMIPWIIYVSGKLPTYPSPKPTLALTSHLGQIHQMISWIIICFWETAHLPLP